MCKSSGRAWYVSSTQDRECVGGAGLWGLSEGVESGLDEDGGYLVLSMARWKAYMSIDERQSLSGPVIRYLSVGFPPGASAFASSSAADLLPSQAIS